MVSTSRLASIGYSGNSRQRSIRDRACGQCLAELLVDRRDAVGERGERLHPLLHRVGARVLHPVGEHHGEGGQHVLRVHLLHERGVARASSATARTPARSPAARRRTCSSAASCEMPSAAFMSASWREQGGALHDPPDAPTAACLPRASTSAPPPQVTMCCGLQREQGHVSRAPQGFSAHHSRPAPARRPRSRAGLSPAAPPRPRRCPGRECTTSAFAPDCGEARGLLGIDASRFRLHVGDQGHAGPCRASPAGTGPGRAPAG